MKKISKRATKTLSKISQRVDTESIIKYMRQVAKSDPGLIEKFKEYGVSRDAIDSVHIEFVPLDVSAKTKDKKIYINEKFLDKPINEFVHYIIHELVHLGQQISGAEKTKNTDDVDYLDLPTEESAFKTQIDFKKRFEGEDEAERYVEQLLDYHDVAGKERKEKEKELLGE